MDLSWKEHSCGLRKLTLYISNLFAGPISLNSANSRQEPTQNQKCKVCNFSLSSNLVQFWVFGLEILQSRLKDKISTQTYKYNSIYSSEHILGSLSMAILVTTEVWSFNSFKVWEPYLRNGICNNLLILCMECYM